MRRIATGLCVAASFALGVTVAAQQTPPAQTSKAASDKDSKTVTLTGCLQQGADASSFTLANALVEKPAGAAAAGTSGTAAGTTTGGAATGTASAAHGSEAPATWTLAPSSGVDLKPHVGHKVQVMGTAASDMAMSKTEAKGTSTTASGAKTETSAKGELSMGAHKLNVTSVKHIAETCSM
jgi:hypothetical protein